MTGRVATVMIGVIALLAVVLVPTACATPRTGQPTFGTLISLVDQTDQEARAGVTVAVATLDWRRVEPAPGRFDDELLREFKSEIDTMRASGRTLTIGFGLHETPDWVLALPDSRLVDNTGAVSDSVNLVFNLDLRRLAERYIAHVATVLDLGALDGLRLTSGGLPEVPYPGTGTYWAFDRNAQNGPARPPSLPPNPAPGWQPGQAGLNEEEVRAWSAWYIGALDDVVVWQIATLSGLGFRGHYEVATPGLGVLPEQYDEAIRQGLPPNLLGTGGAWAEFYRNLPRRSDIIAHVTSVADGSGGNDGCQPDDASVPLNAPEIATWSATRWITRVARENGYAVSGENPGWHASPELDVAYRDPSDAGMMADAVRQARSCGFRTFYWAHDEQLWDGTVPFRSFADRIAEPS